MAHAQFVVLFASEVAAAAGMNKFKHPVCVVESMWKRHGETYNNTISKLHRSGKHKVGTLEDRIRHTEKVQPKIAEAVCFARDAHVSDNHSLEAAIKQLKKLTADAQTSTESRTDTHIDAEESTVVDAEHHTEIKKHLVSKLQCSYGTHTEPIALQKTAEENRVTINKCNDQSYKVALRTTPKVILIGRIDGMADNKLVEVKSRRYKFIVPVPEYDLVQMHCYMLLVNQPTCTLIEQCKGERKETQITWDNDLWTRVTRALEKFAMRYLEFMSNPQAQEQLAEMPTEKSKREFWDR